MNVDNEDNKCFLWAVLASCHHNPEYHHVLKPHHLAEFEQEIDMTDISYPVEVRDFPKIEKLNPGLTINLYGYRPFKKKNRKEGHSIFPIRVSETIGERHVDLLYLSSETKSHYVYIKNLNRLIAGQFKDGYTGRGMHLCRRCLQNFGGARTLEKHVERCKEHRAQRTVFPRPEANSDTRKSVTNSRCRFMQ